MAGHSKFKNIMHRKGAQDKKRSKLFSKLSKEITVAAKMGDPNPDMNPRLRLAVQNAKAQSMPKENIERAIKKSQGSVSFMFDKVGEITYPASAGTADDILEAAIEAGAQDASSDEESHVIICAFEDLGEVSASLGESLGEAESVNIIWKPQNLTPVDEEKAATLLKLIDVLEDDDDVQNVFANYDISDEVMEKLAVA